MNIKNLMSVLGLKPQNNDRHSGDLRLYRGDKFSLKYPIDWQVTNEKGIINFFPNENYGAVTLSERSGITFPMAKTRECLLDMHQVKDHPENVKMTSNGNVFEFRYEHVEKEIRWITKIVRRNYDFYHFTINCKTDKWERSKTAFIDTLESFKLD
jgi:hypothetical protein